jgi:hypothetical protein
MDMRTPETLAATGVFIAALAIGGGLHAKPATPPPVRTAPLRLDACPALPGAQMAKLLGRPVTEAQALPGLDGPNCYYELDGPKLALLVEWRNVDWAAERGRQTQVGASDAPDIAPGALWIAEDTAAEAPVSKARALYVGFWNMGGDYPPENARAMVAAVTRQLLAAQTPGGRS